MGAPAAAAPLADESVRWVDVEELPPDPQAAAARASPPSTSAVLEV
jgi:hypothetical protein